jgi:hypothetical protein
VHENAATSGLLNVGEVSSRANAEYCFWTVNEGMSCDRRIGFACLLAPGVLVSSHIGDVQCSIGNWQLMMIDNAIFLLSPF